MSKWTCQNCEYATDIGSEAGKHEFTHHGNTLVFDSKNDMVDEWGIPFHYMANPEFSF